MELKDKLVSLRKSKGLSQSDLSEVLNVSRQAVSRWEVGTSIPSMENLITLGKLYDVPLDELVSIGEIQKSTVQALEKDGKEEKEDGKQKDTDKEYYHIKKSLVNMGIMIFGILIICLSVLTTYFIHQQRLDEGEEVVRIEDMNSDVIDEGHVTLGSLQTIK